MVLLKMKATAESYLGCTINNNVIPVPAYFNDWPQKTLRLSLELTHFVSSPNPQLLLSSSVSTIKVSVNIFDLGGGTCDVSLRILSIEDYVVEVKANAGVAHLGGEDFNNSLFVQKRKILFTQAHFMRSIFESPISLSSSHCLRACQTHTIFC